MLCYISDFLYENAMLTSTCPTVWKNHYNSRNSRNVCLCLCWRHFRKCHTSSVMLGAAEFQAFFQCPIVCDWPSLPSAVTDDCRLIFRFSYNARYRGWSKILQGRVSNPSERGTGGRAPKAPRRVRSGEGQSPLPRIFFCISYIKMVSFYASAVIFIDTM